MTPTELRAVGEALYGNTWQTALALDLGTDVRLVRRWLADERPMPKDIRPRLIAVCRARKSGISAAMKILRD